MGSARRWMVFGHTPHELPNKTDLVDPEFDDTNYEALTG